MKNLRRYVKYVGYAFKLLILGVMVFSVVEYVQGIQPFYTVSDNPSSMSPTINYGDAVMVYRAPFDSLQAGDIIIFNDPRGNVGATIHRIVAVEDDGSGSTYILTKGDNNVTNPVIDPWKVTQQYYLSKVLIVLPLVGYTSPALWGFSGLSAFLPITLVVVFVVLIGSLKKKREQMSQTNSRVEVFSVW